MVLFELPMEAKCFGHCKDCKFCECATVTNIEGIPLMISRDIKICSKWGDGCKTKDDGFCFMFEPKESEEQI